MDNLNDENVKTWRVSYRCDFPRQPVPKSVYGYNTQNHKKYQQ